MNIILFLVGLGCGAILGSSILLYFIRKSEKNFQKGIENMFSKILFDFYQLTFIKRINKQVFFRFKDWEIILILDQGTLHIFEGEKCIASSTQTGNSLVVQKVIKQIGARWRKDIEDTIVIDNNEFSVNIIRDQKKKFKNQKWSDPLLNKIESESKKEIFDVDSILDKINRIGYTNLSEAELKFLNSL